MSVAVASLMGTKQALMLLIASKFELVRYKGVIYSLYISHLLFMPKLYLHISWGKPNNHGLFILKQYPTRLGGKIPLAQKPYRLSHTPFLVGYLMNNPWYWFFVRFHLYIWCIVICRSADQVQAKQARSHIKATEKWALTVLPFFSPSFSSFKASINDTLKASVWQCGIMGGY